MTSRSTSLKLAAARLATALDKGSDAYVMNAKRGDRVSYYGRVVEFTSDPQPTHRGYYLIPFTVVSGPAWDNSIGTAAVNAHGRDRLSPVAR